MKFCEQCGQGNQEDAQFCIQCGAPLQAEVPPRTGQAQPPGPPVIPPAPGTAGAPAGGVATPVQPSQPVSQYGVPPMPATTGQQTEPFAVASVVLSAASFLVCPFVAAIVGIIFGYLGLSRIDESRGTLGGRDLARIGIILGWVHVGLALLAAIVILALVISGVIVAN